ncbi:MAG: YARHG domain-containing protein [Clostridiales bacterium]|nr:YARHG domain-containing protein [Clostridiales bacterium]
MFCSNCGSEVKDGIAFCPNCGSQMGKDRMEKMADTDDGVTRKESETKKQTRKEKKAEKKGGKEKSVVGNSVNDGKKPKKKRHIGRNIGLVILAIIVVIIICSVVSCFNTEYTDDDRAKSYCSKVKQGYLGDYNTVEVQNLLESAYPDGEWDYGYPDDVSYFIVEYTDEDMIDIQFRIDPSDDDTDFYITGFASPGSDYTYTTEEAAEVLHSLYWAYGTDNENTGIDVDDIDETDTSVLTGHWGPVEEVVTEEMEEDLSAEEEVTSEAEVSEETKQFSEGVSDDYAQYSFMMDTDAVIADYHERGYDYVWLESHEVMAPEDGAIGDFGTQDEIYVLATAVGENDTYYITEEIGVLYVYWGEETGWANNYQVGTLEESDFSGFTDTYWKYEENSYYDAEDDYLYYADAIVGDDIDYEAIEASDSIEVYIHLENFDDIYGTIEGATSFSSVNLHGETSGLTYGTAMLIMDGNIYTRDIEYVSGSSINIGESVLFELSFDLDNEIAFSYALDGNNQYDTWISISEDEYMSASKGGTVVSDNTGDEDQDYILPNSDTSYLSKSDLENLTAEELRIARNEIYARHGRIFTDDSLNEYFNSKSWYNGTISADDFDNSILNEYEKANAELISEYESEMGY